jgi:hypothetical protein
MAAVIKPADAAASTRSKDGAQGSHEKVIRAEEAPTRQPEAAKKHEDKSGKALEWTKAVGMPLVTLVITVLGGYYFTSLAKEREIRETSFLKEREARDSNERMYAQLLTQREQSDTLIRKDMFGVVISSFLKGDGNQGLSDKVLQLELLANNFNQSLDLAPLFKDLARKLSQSNGLSIEKTAELKKRLDTTAKSLIAKQVDSLRGRGFVIDQAVDLTNWEKLVGEPFINKVISKSALVPSATFTPKDDNEQVQFRVEVFAANIPRREVEIRLRANFPGGSERQIDSTFWVGQYDFPMLDNIQLPHGLRASVVITDFNVPEAQKDRGAANFAKFHLVVFPGAAASFKERQDYDDILNDMLRAKRKSTRQEGDQS